MTELFEPFSYPFSWPDLRGKRVLVVGLGGGADAISAYAVAQALDVGPEGAALYASAKGQVEDDLERLSPHIARAPGEATPLESFEHQDKTTSLERAIPRGAGGSPLILLLPAREDEAQEAAFLAELQGLNADLVIGVDTGGDVLMTTRRRGQRGPGQGRDRRTLSLLRRSGLPLLLFVLAPGIDGTNSREKILSTLRGEKRKGHFLGAFPLSAMMPVYRAFAPHLPAKRPPAVLVEAADSSEDFIRVPRGSQPLVPRRWLMSGLAFSVAPPGSRDAEESAEDAETEEA